MSTTVRRAVIVLLTVPGITHLLGTELGPASVRATCTRAGETVTADLFFDPANTPTTVYADLHRATTDPAGTS